MLLTNNIIHHSGVESGQGHCKCRGLLCFCCCCFFILLASAFRKARVWGESILSLSFPHSFQRVMSNSAFLKIGIIILGRKEKLPLKQHLPLLSSPEPCMPWFCGLTSSHLNSQGRGGWEDSIKLRCTRIRARALLKSLH